MEGTGVQQGVDACAGIELAGVAVLRQALVAAHRSGRGSAALEILEDRLPSVGHDLALPDDRCPALGACRVGRFPAPAGSDSVRATVLVAVCRWWHTRMLERYDDRSVGVGTPQR